MNLCNRDETYCLGLKFDCIRHEAAAIDVSHESKHFVPYWIFLSIYALYTLTSVTICTIFPYHSSVET